MLCCLRVVVGGSARRTIQRMPWTSATHVSKTVMLATKQPFCFFTVLSSAVPRVSSVKTALLLARPTPASGERRALPLWSYRGFGLTCGAAAWNTMCC